MSLNERKSSFRTQPLQWTPSNRNLNPVRNGTSIVSSRPGLDSVRSRPAPRVRGSTTNDFLSYLDKTVKTARIDAISFPRDLPADEANGATVPMAPNALAPNLGLVPMTSHLPPLPTEQLRRGHVWPPADGRLMLAQARPEGATLRSLSSGDWTAERGPWRFYTSVNSLYSDEQDARIGLFEWARWHTEERERLSPFRCLAMVGNPGGAWRLWQTFLAEPPLAREVERSLIADMPEAIAEVLLETARLLEEAQAWLAPARLPVGLETVGVVGSRPVYVGSVPSPGFIEILSTHPPPRSLDLGRQFTAVIERTAFAASPKRAEVADRLLEAARTPAFEERALGLAALVTAAP